MRQDTRQAALNKWRSILPAFGLSVNLLNGKHQTCPICQAKNKFRFTNYKSGGEWICTHGAGDGFELAMAVTGLDFKEVAKQIDKLLNNNELKEVFQPEVDYESRRRNLNKVWAGATSDCHLDYLKSRLRTSLIPSILTDIRGHDALWHEDVGEKRPCMVALIRNKKGEPVSIHRTFFQPKAKKIMPTMEKLSGASVRMMNTMEGPLVVGEGIETTLEGMRIMSNFNGMAGISAHGMETLIVPNEFQDVVLLGDNDRSFTGQKAVFTLGRRLDAEKRRVRIVIPKPKGHDILDSHDEIHWWSNQ